MPSTMDSWHRTLVATDAMRRRALWRPSTWMKMGLLIGTSSPCTWSGPFANTPRPKRLMICCPLPSAKVWSQPCKMNYWSRFDELKQWMQGFFVDRFRKTDMNLLASKFAFYKWSGLSPLFTQSEGIEKNFWLLLNAIFFLKFTVFVCMKFWKCFNFFSLRLVVWALKRFWESSHNVWCMNYVVDQSVTHPYCAPYSYSNVPSNHVSLMYQERVCKTEKRFEKGWCRHYICYTSYCLRLRVPPFFLL